jgi:hypothetical protein
MVALQVIDDLGNIARSDHVCGPLNGRPDLHVDDVDLLECAVIEIDGSLDGVEHRIAEVREAALCEQISGEIQQRLGCARG